MKRTSIATSIALVTSLIVCTGCASSTTITSNPEGASLIIDGQPVGATPVTFSKSTVWAWTSHQVRLEAKGYDTRTGFVQATISPGHLAVGIICFIPLFPLAFVGRYEPRYHFEMTKRSTITGAPEWREVARIDFE